MMKKFLFFVCSIVFSVSLLNAQSITTNSNVPLESLIGDTLVNGCIQVSNITANNGAKGYFRKGDSQFPFNSGIILATGSISNAQGPNSSGSAGNSVGSGSDPDLQALIPSYTINDASVIQFDFIPAENVVTFRYIFGSEEFPEYANTSFNDVFGFFLSGPGINGPYSNNAINIALLPNNQPVTINNVHNFNYYTAYPTSASNSPGSYYGAVQYDGNTIILTATATVVACETYHIKLAIGDAGDSAYDSGVFIEAGSFISGESITISNIAQVGSESDLWEGCTNYYVVSREEGSDAQQDLLISVGIAPNSTATEGVDFSPFPTTVFIPAGQMTDTIWYTAYNDGIEEGHETIIVMFYTACPCGNYSTAIYDTIWIYDAEFIKGGIQDITTHYCGQDPPATITLVGECNIDPHVGYYWSTGATTNSIQITP
ncbi:MAG TPA: choice-of-anchor L domain-containing protein [Bacteroidales bacterium]|nr:choice-of-anchor L domain-containing protein [Bacteroidales bacterium]